MSRAPRRVDALNDVDVSGASQITLSVGSKNPSSSLEMRLDRPNGPKIADISFMSTGAGEYVIPGSMPAGDIRVKEMAYRDVTASLKRPIFGAHDLYMCSET